MDLSEVELQQEVRKWGRQMKTSVSWSLPGKGRRERNMQVKESQGKNNPFRINCKFLSFGIIGVKHRRLNFS